MKRDAPSGTALAWGEVVAADARTDARKRSRCSTGMAVSSRACREPIGFAALRGGDIVGEHTVTFAIAGERVELTHRATDRITFARGALRAAVWSDGAAARPVYTMNDVLGFAEQALDSRSKVSVNIRAPVTNARINLEKREGVLQGAPPALRICGEPRG